MSGPVIGGGHHQENSLQIGPAEGTAAPPESLVPHKLGEVGRPVCGHRVDEGAAPEEFPGLAQSDRPAAYHEAVAPIQLENDGIHFRRPSFHLRNRHDLGDHRFLSVSGRVAPKNPRKMKTAQHP